LYSQTGEALSDAIKRRRADGLAQLHDLERRIEQHRVVDPEGTYKIAEAYAVLGDKESTLRMFRYSIENVFFSWPISGLARCWRAYARTRSFLFDGGRASAARSIQTAVFLKRDTFISRNAVERGKSHPYPCTPRRRCSLNNHI
jgi:hypothetical protein